MTRKEHLPREVGRTRISDVPTVYHEPKYPLAKEVGFSAPCRLGDLTEAFLLAAAVDAAVGGNAATQFATEVEGHLNRGIFAANNPISPPDSAPREWLWVGLLCFVTACSRRVGPFTLFYEGGHLRVANVGRDLAVKIVRTLRPEAKPVPVLQAAS